MNITLQNISLENISESTVENTSTESVYNSISQNTTAVLDSYIYQDGNKIIYSESETVEYDSIKQCRDAIDNYFSFYFRQLATIPNVTTGHCYLINLSKVINYFVQSSNLVIQLSDEILTIPCINATHATNHLNYLDFAVKNNSYEIASAGKTPIYVDEDNYSTLTAALNVATSSNIVVVDKMLSESVILRNGVDIWFNAGSGNEYNSESLKLFYTNNQNVTCNIYGYGIFTNNATGGSLANPLFLLSGSTNINIGFQEINTASVRACIYAEGSFGTVTMRAKGHTMTGRPLDSDYDTYLVDCDAVSMKNIDGADVVIYPDNNLGTYYYIRNAFMSNDSDVYGTMYMQSSETNIYDINLINVRAVNNGSMSVIESPGDETHTVRMFNTYLKADTQPIHAQYETTNVISYGDTNIINVENYADVNLTGTIIIDSNLTISET